MHGAHPIIHEKEETANVVDAISSFSILYTTYYFNERTVL